MMDPALACGRARETDAASPDSVLAFLSRFSANGLSLSLQTAEVSGEKTRGAIYFQLVMLGAS